jgi:hypothetical protein
MHKHPLRSCSITQENVTHFGLVTRPHNHAEHIQILLSIIVLGRTPSVSTTSHVCRNNGIYQGPVSTKFAQTRRCELRMRMIG